MTNDAKHTVEQTGKYRYFVAYLFSGGRGRCELSRDELITSIEDIDSMEDSIAKCRRLTGVTVVNYQLFVEPLEAQP